MSSREDNILAFIWYHEHDYAKLLEASEDAKGLQDCYEDWLLGAQRAFAHYEQLGFQPRRVYVDVDEYLAWCAQRDRRVDEHSREMFKEIRRQQFYRDIDGDD